MIYQRNNVNYTVMVYDEALKRAWDDLGGISKERTIDMRFLAETYTINVCQRSVTRMSDRQEARDHISIILLHYLARKIRMEGIPVPSGEWINFTQFEGGHTYYPVFKKRVLDILALKFTADPRAFLKKADAFSAKNTSGGDTGIIIEPLENVPMTILLWYSDAEFGPAANAFFDRTIKEIFCTEDIVVMAEIVAHSF